MNQEFYVPLGLSSWIEEEERQNYIDRFSNIKKFTECAIRYAEMGRGDLVLQSRQEILYEFSRMALIERNPAGLDITERKECRALEDEEKS